MDLRKIHREDVFGLSLGKFESQGQRSKIKVTKDKNDIFRPFLAACVQFMFGKASLVSSY